MDDKKPKQTEKAALGPVRKGAAAVAFAICRLCQQPRVLRDSHFIPAAFYYHLGLDETGTLQNQALEKLTRSRFARVPGQIKKNLLCDECEQRLSANGESWVTRFAHQIGRRFRLQEALLRLEPRMTLATGRIYYVKDHPTIDWKKLAYFALTLFWRRRPAPWEPSPYPVTNPL